MSNLERRRLLTMGVLGTGLAALGLEPMEAVAQVCSGYGITITPSTTITDYFDTFSSAITAARAAGGGYILIASGIYRFSKPILVPKGVSLIGEAPRGEQSRSNQVAKRGTVLAKLGGFVGEALVRVVPIGSVAPSDILIDGIVIQDDASTKLAGGGLVIQGATGNVSLNNVAIIGHRRWGITVTSSKGCSFSGITCAENGQGEPAVGGVKIDNSSDCRIVDSRFSANYGNQMLMTGSTSSSISELSIIDCHMELSGISVSVPIVQIDALYRSTFRGCTLDRAGQLVSCLQLGSSSSSREVRSVTFESCNFVFDALASTVVPIKLLGSTTTTAISFLDVRYSTGGALVINASQLAVGATSKILVSSIPPIPSTKIGALAGVVVTPSLL